MISIRNVTTAAAALSIVVSLGASGVASAQTAPTDPANTSQNANTTQNETRSGTKPMSQNAIDREKVILKDTAQQHIDAANANIDELRKVSSKATGSTKKQHDDMEKRLSDSRDRLKGDLGRIDGANTSDWQSVRSAVERDVTAMNSQLRRASAVTKVPVPATGVTNEQPKTP